MKATEVVVEYMKDNKITYRDLAKRMGTSAMNVWYILNRRKEDDKESDPKLGTLMNLCTVLDIPIRIVRDHSRESTTVDVGLEQFQDLPVSAVSKLLNLSGRAIEINSRII